MMISNPQLNGYERTESRHNGNGEEEAKRSALLGLLGHLLKEHKVKPNPGMTDLELDLLSNSLNQLTMEEM